MGFCLGLGESPRRPLPDTHEQISCDTLEQIPGRFSSKNTHCEQPRMLACSQVITSHRQDGPSGRVGLTSSLAGPGLAEEAERPAQEMGGSGSPSSPMPPSRPGPHRTVCQPQRARPPHAPVASPRPGPPTWAEEARVCQDGRPRPPRNPSPRPAAASVAMTSKSGRKVILDRCVTAPASLRSCGGRW